MNKISYTAYVQHCCLSTSSHAADDKLLNSAFDGVWMRNIFQHGVGGLAPAPLQQLLHTPRVLVEEGGYIEHLAVDDDPAIRDRVVSGDLLLGEGLAERALGLGMATAVPVRVCCLFGFCHFFFARAGGAEGYGGACITVVNLPSSMTTAYSVCICAFGEVCMCVCEMGGWGILTPYFGVALGPDHNGGVVGFRKVIHHIQFESSQQFD